MAEIVRDELGLTYVGVDSDEEALESLRSRGFQAHNLEISGSSEKIVSSIESLPLEGRIAAISVLDGIEHLPNFREALKAIGVLAKKFDCPLVLSIPNVTHVDVGIKLAAGLWDYTETGLLDDTHVRFFTEKNLKEELRKAGLEVIEQNNLRLQLSDQHFPIDHPFLSSGSSIHKLLMYLRSNDTNATVNQFVWLCVTGATRGGEQIPKSEIEYSTRPFITVVIRTQGRRLGQLGEALLCLASQSFQDFEVLIVGHSLNQEQQKGVSELLESFPFVFQAKIRFDLVKGGTRTAPLNYALTVANGQYFTFFDDDDLVFSNWLEVFHELSLKSPGIVLRSRAAEQDFSIDKDNPEISRAESAMRTIHNSEFSLVEHLIQNQSPFMTLAFPRAVHDHLGMRFSEDMSTTEDWDFLLRVASLLGVENSETITAVYRKWINLESSSSVKGREWSSNEAMIRGTLSKIPIILPPGEVLMLSSILDKRAEEKFQVRAQQIEADARAQQIEADARAQQIEADARAQQIEADARAQHVAFQQLILTLESRSWRWTKLARGVVNFLKRKREFSLRNLNLQDISAIQQSTDLIQGSIWWRITKKLRKT
jgi:hypothetical protein